MEFFPYKFVINLKTDAVICYGTGFIVNFDSFYVKKVCYIIVEKELEKFEL